MAIADTNTLSATTRSFGQFIEQTNWLHSNYGPDRDRKHRLDRLLQCVASLYKYCCNWANTRNVYQRHGREGAVPLTDEAAEAFRLLYEQCKRMQDLVLRYVLSEQFAREVAKQPKETANQQHCVLIDGNDFYSNKTEHIHTNMFQCSAGSRRYYSRRANSMFAAAPICGSV